MTNGNARMQHKHDLSLFLKSFSGINGFERFCISSTKPRDMRGFVSTGCYSRCIPLMSCVAMLCEATFFIENFSKFLFWNA